MSYARKTNQTTDPFWDENMKIVGKFVIMAIMVLISLTMAPIYAQSYPAASSPEPSNTQLNQVKISDKGSIKVGFYTDPANPNTSDKTTFHISFLNKDTGQIQQHVDYRVSVIKGNDQVFGILVTHTAEGSVSIPFQFLDSGTYHVIVEVDGILFQSISTETTTFTVNVQSSTIPEFPQSIAIVFIIGIVSTIILAERLRLILI